MSEWEAEASNQHARRIAIEHERDDWMVEVENLAARLRESEAELAAAYDRGYVAGAAALQTVIDRAEAAEGLLRGLRALVEVLENAWTDSDVHPRHGYGGDCKHCARVYAALAAHPGAPAC